MADDERPVLVTGGTGTLGRALVHTLLDAGRPVRVLSRRDPSPAAPDAVEWVVGDLLTGDGLREALDGVAAVVHCASDPRKPDRDLDAAVQLLLAARAAEVPHLVYISIVGVDRVPFAYYKAKRRVEEIVEDGGVPWTIQRATQFHDFVATLLDVLSRGPVAIAPAGMDDQPVDVREVARAAGRAGRTPARPAAWTTWAGRRCSPPPSSCARTSRRPVGADRCGACRCRGWAGSAAATTSRPSTRSAG